MAKKIDSRTADYKIGDKEYKRNWFVIDAAGVPLGRLASTVASVLKGKTKPEYTPNVDVGDFVIVVNSDKVVLTGNKANAKLRTYHTGYMGGLKQQKYSHFLEENSDKAIQKAVKGMLPKNSLGRQMIKKLKVFKGAEHNHEAQKPQPLAIKLYNDKAN
ncbi:MAG: 50S ribosomal protein L13 [Clostridiales bacterium]|nr:50S ribosomal protein L13 [Clostridiales bacterium]